MPAPAAPEKPVEVTLRVEAITKAGQHFIESDDTLRTGDRLALHVGVSEASYVYVGLASAAGTRALVFPASTAQTAVQPGTEQRIPAAGQWFKLDRDTGQEDVFVYASRRQLTSAEALDLVKKDSGRVKKPAAASPKKTSVKRPAATPRDDAPEALSPDTRGLEVVGDPTQDQASDGVARRRFTIQHRR
jgi:hypothetical protein